MSASHNFNREAILNAARIGARKAVNAVTIQFQNEVGRQLNQHASNRSRGGIPSAPGTPPGKATGTLARSWQVTPVRDDSKLADPLRPRVRLGSNLVYARIHEYGGTISGRPWLKIPVSLAAKRAEAGGSSLTMFRGNKLFFLNTNGKLKLVSRKNKRGGIVTHYVLKKSVKVPQRPYVRPAAVVTQAKAAEIATPFMRAALRGFSNARGA